VPGEVAGRSTGGGGRQRRGGASRGGAARCSYPRALPFLSLPMRSARTGRHPVGAVGDDGQSPRVLRELDARAGRG